MKLLPSLVSVSACLAFGPSFAQDRNPWRDNFTCSVNWFASCEIEQRKPGAESVLRKELKSADNPLLPQHRLTPPEPVRNVLENPSPETAKAYVLWSRQANEKLAKASEYIAQITREMTTSAAAQQDSDRVKPFSTSNVGPMGLYYFFSPADRTALTDVRVLNKIFQEGRLGVAGILVTGKDEEIVRFLNEARPLFPVRRSEAEVRMIKPGITPELHLALPLEKRVFRIGQVVNEAAIMKAIGDILRYVR